LILKLVLQFQGNPDKKRRAKAGIEVYRMWQI